MTYDDLPDWLREGLARVKYNYEQGRQSAETGSQMWPTVARVSQGLASDPEFGMGFAGGGVGGVVKAIGKPGAATRLLQSFAPRTDIPRASVGIRTSPMGQETLWDIKGEPKGVFELIRHLQRTVPAQDLDAMRVGPLMPKPDIYNFAKGMAERSRGAYPNFAKRLDAAADMSREDALRYGIPWD